MKEKLSLLVSSCFKELFAIEDEIKAEISVPQEKYGDYSTNAPILLAQKIGRPIFEIAEAVAKKLSGNGLFEKVEPMRNGFINMTLSQKTLEDSVKNIIKEDSNYGKSNYGEHKKVLIEFVSANPTGPLHVGHGRWAVIGDVIANILDFSGYKVEREFYVNDIGNQIDKLEASVIAKINGEPVPENGYGGDYIGDLALKFASEKKDLRTKILHEMLSQQKEVLSKLDVNFDRFFSEKNLHEENKVKKAIDLLKEKKLTFEQDGALWFKSKDFGDDKDRVIVRENGETTYFASDIAYHLDKFDRGYDILIDVWGADHHGYVPRLKSALKALGKSVDNFEVIIGQLVSLYRGKEPVRMSKRTGDMVTLEEVVEEVGKDATRFFMAINTVNTHLSFDLELAKQEASNNPVYYVQYAHARISSIIREAEEKKIMIEKDPDLSLINHSSEKKLIKKLIEFPDLVIVASKRKEPHLLVEYSKNLAALFHNFYHQCRVVSDDQKLTNARLALMQATRIVLKNVLKLLKVSAPERM